MAKSYFKFILCSCALVASGFAPSVRAASATHTPQFLSGDLDAALYMRGRNEVDAALVCRIPDDTSLSKEVVTLWLNIAVAKGDIDYQPNEPIVINGRLIPLILNLKINGTLYRTTKLGFYQNKQNMIFLLGDIVDPGGVIKALSNARRVEILGDQRTLSVEVGDHAKQLKTLAGDCADLKDLRDEFLAKAKRKK